MRPPSKNPAMGTKAVEVVPKPLPKITPAEDVDKGLNPCAPMAFLIPALLAACRQAYQTVSSEMGFSTPRCPSVLGNR
jgi:hypothetical protein